MAVPTIVATIVWLPAWSFLVLVACVVEIAGYEFLSMVRRSGINTARVMPLLCLAGTMVASWAFGPIGLCIASAAVMTVLPAVQLAHRDRPRGSLSSVAVSCFVVLFLGIAGSCIGWLRLLPGDAAGPRLVLLFLATVWISDTAAYYVGSRLGRHRMAPRISPGKTWEGLAAGTLATFAAAAAGRAVLSLPIAWPHVAAFATIIALATPVGDLVESQFKRDAGIKDSSRLLPGHGGFLDRTDSLLYAAAPALGYLVMSGVVPS